MGHSGLIFRGYCLGPLRALARGACFSPRTPCSLNASGHAVCSSATIRSSPQLALLLRDFQYAISPHGQNRNHLKSFMRNSWLCFRQAAFAGHERLEGDVKSREGKPFCPLSHPLYPPRFSGGLGQKSGRLGWEKLQPGDGGFVSPLRRPASQARKLLPTAQPGALSLPLNLAEASVWAHLGCGGRSVPSLASSGSPKRSP